MIGRIYHVGLTVSDMDRSIAFYRDVLGLEFQGEIFMSGEETDRMFGKKIVRPEWLISMAPKTWKHHMWN